MSKQNMPFSVRLTADMDSRFAAAAEKVKMPKNAIARQAIEGAVEAIEKHNGAVVVPIKFDVTKVPSPKRS